MGFFLVVKKKVVSGTRAASEKARRKGVMERVWRITSSEQCTWQGETKIRLKPEGRDGKALKHQATDLGPE